MTKQLVTQIIDTMDLAMIKHLFSHETSLRASLNHKQEVLKNNLIKLMDIAKLKKRGNKNFEEQLHPPSAFNQVGLRFFSSELRKIEHSIRNIWDSMLSGSN